MWSKFCPPNFFVDKNYFCRQLSSGSTWPIFACTSGTTYVLREKFHRSGISVIFPLASSCTTREAFQYHKFSTSSIRIVDVDSQIPAVVKKTDTQKWTQLTIKDGHSHI